MTDDVNMSRLPLDQIVDDISKVANTEGSPTPMGLAVNPPTPAERLRNLARFYLKVGKWCSEQAGNNSKLDPEQREKLDDTSEECFLLAARLLRVSTDHVFAGKKKYLADVEEATKKGNETIGKIETFTTAIRLVSGLIVLGVSLAAQDWDAVKTNATGIFDIAKKHAKENG